MSAPTRTSSEKGKAPVLGVPLAPSAAPAPSQDLSPTGSQPGSPVSRCIAAINNLEQHYISKGSKAPKAFMVTNGCLRGLFLRPSRGPTQPPSAKVRKLVHTGSVPDSRTQSPSQASPATTPDAADKAATAEFDERKSRESVRKRAPPPSAKTTPVSKRLSFAGSRPVSRDLPYSLLVSERAGPSSWEDAGYSSEAAAEADMRQYIDWTTQKDARAETLRGRLVLAGFLDFEPPVTRGSPLPSPVPASGEPSPPYAQHTGPSVAAATGSGYTVPPSTTGPSAFSYPRVYVHPEIAYKRNAKILDKELPPRLDLDDRVQVNLCFSRYETICNRIQAEHDSFVHLLEARVCQGQAGEYREKARLCALTNWSNQHRSVDSTLEYEPFKATVVRLAGGTAVKYTRRTLQLLSQKTSGSFDKYLSDFETQCTHVEPSPAEKLEVFLAGLNPGLRNRVLVRSDGTDWAGWDEFLTVVHRFADADLRSRDLPSKVFEVEKKTSVTETSTKRQASSSDSQKDKKKQKKQLATSTAGPSTAAASQAKSTSTARADVIRQMAKDANLCANCLQAKHTGDRKPSGMCARPRADPLKVWGAAFTTAYDAHKAASGKPF